MAKLCTEKSELHNLNLKIVSKTLNNCQFLSRLELSYVVIIRFPRVGSEWECRIASDFIHVGCFR